MIRINSWSGVLRSFRSSQSALTISRPGFNPGTRGLSYHHLPPSHPPRLVTLSRLDKTSTSSQSRLFASAVPRYDFECGPNHPASKTDHPQKQTQSSTFTSFSTSAADPTQPQRRHWSDTEPGDLNQLVNPNGRIYSVRQPPDDSASQDLDRFYSSIFTPKTPSIFKAFIFFSLTCFGSFSLAAYYVTRDSDRLAQEIHSHSFSSFGSLSSFFGGGVAAGASSVGEAKLRVAKKQEIAQRLGWRMEWISGWCDQLGFSPKVKEFVGTVYLGLAERYLELGPAQQAIVPIVALSSLIFLLWQIPGRRALRFMSKHFLHSPASGRHYQMLTSVFSHQSLAHFAFNNIAFWSFGAAALVSPLFLERYHSQQKGAQELSRSMPEASITPHLLAFFVTAGVFSSLVSHTVVALRFRRASLLGGIELAKRTVGRHSGLGASGAIYAVVVMHALSYPDNRLSLIFLPFFSFPIGTGLGAMLAVDMLGAIRGWKMFDHFCHLGGAAFGWLYFNYGKQWWEASKMAVGRFRNKEEVSVETQRI